MNRKGITLIELVVVIGIMSILLSMATISFNQWTRQREIEKDVKALYADLMYYRQQSMVTGMNHRIRFGPAATAVAFRRYNPGDAVGTEVNQRTMLHDLSRSVWANPSATDIEFNSRGVMVDPLHTDKTLCFYSDVEPSVDAIFITTTKINVAKIINQGNNCEKANIRLR